MDRPFGGSVLEVVCGSVKKRWREVVAGEEEIARKFLTADGMGRSMRVLW